MLARVQSYLLQGIDALPCEIEVDHDPGASGNSGTGEARISVVGLPDAAVKESIERVKAALANSGLAVPLGRVLVNLAPADLRKEGPLYDLPIAVGMLIAQGHFSPRPSAPARNAAASASSKSASSKPSAPIPEHEPLDHRQFLFAGELALDGRLRPIRGVIALATLAKSKGARGVIVPHANALEAAVVPGVEALGVSTLTEVVGLLLGHIEPQPIAPLDVHALLCSAESPIDFADVRGQEAVKRAMTIAAAGAHNILLVGPPGTGKTMMARALTGVLPPLTPEEAVEITRIYSAAGHLPPGVPLITSRPVRSPHHTASTPALVGGGAIPRPGEVSLAHRGVLFLDELPEFDRDALETLRQPLEDHVVTIARSHSAVRFPASFMLVAAMNPTPKGDVPRDQVGRLAMERYLSKLSGPLIDRIDIHVEAPAVPWKQLAPSTRAEAAKRGTSSATIRDRVQRARQRQVVRQGPTTPNSRLTGRQLDELAQLDEQAKDMLGQAMTELGLSARAYDKVRRIALTIADLAAEDGPISSTAPSPSPERITSAHLAEAISYRLLDRRT